VLARPFVFALGLLMCLAGAITCAAASPDDPQSFPALADVLMPVGVILAMLGVAGRDPRGRQMLGRRPNAPASDPTPRAPPPDPS